MNKIFVVNKRNHAPTDRDFYIGRGSILGNPYTSKELGKTKAVFQADNRVDSIHKYETFLRLELLNNNELFISVIKEMVETLKVGDIYLVCYCKPAICHGDVIKSIVNGLYIREILEEH